MWRKIAPKIVQCEWIQLLILFQFSTVTLIPEEPEDMWHAYNLISEDDRVRSTTIRKVQNETATGSSSSSRVRTTLTICVESIDFDTQACVLRLKGRNVEENQYVKVGWTHFHLAAFELYSSTFTNFFAFRFFIKKHSDGRLSHTWLGIEP